MNYLETAGWLGQLKMTYAPNQRITRPIQSQARAPLKIQKPFYPEASGVCHSVIVHTAGGMVGGDQLGLDFHLHPQSQVLVTTAAASKIYRSQGEIAGQTAHIQVGQSACMEWFPQETIVFNGAFYRQDLRVELGPEAIWAGWDITRFGRSARGEQFLQGNWRSRTEIWRQGTPLWLDRQWLPAGAETLHSPPWTRRLCRHRRFCDRGISDLSRYCRPNPRPLDARSRRRRSWRHPPAARPALPLPRQF